MLVGEIMHSDVKTASATDSFADVAKMMRSNGISSVVVLDGKKLQGIVTERDIVNLVAEGGDPSTTTVEGRMTRLDLITVDDLPDKVHLAGSSRFVVAGGAPEELVTLGEMRHRYLRKVLAISNGNKSLAARILGIDRRTISSRMVSSEELVVEDP